MLVRLSSRWPVSPRLTRYPPLNSPDGLVVLGPCPTLRRVSAGTLKVVLLKVVHILLFILKPPSDTFGLTMVPSPPGLAPQVTSTLVTVPFMTCVSALCYLVRMVVVVRRLLLQSSMGT